MRWEIMKSLMSLWRELAAEAASWCHTSAVRDIKTAADRVEYEGDSFLTITLPSFGKSLLRCLENGKIDDTSFAGFQRRGGLPLFLGGFLRQIFDTDGTLLDEPNVDCIRVVHELTSCMAKIERPCSTNRTNRAMQKFVEVEAEIGSADPASLEEFLPHFRQAATLLWADVFAFTENSLNDTHQILRDWTGDSPQGEFTQTHPGFVGLDSLLGLPGVHLTETVGAASVKPSELFQFGGSITNYSELPLSKAAQFSQGGIIDAPFETLLPKHGPGATADRLLGNEKFDVLEWPLRLESVFPYGDYALASWRAYYQLDRVRFLEPGAERPVKVIAVPKTLKTPRIIAIEPTAMQYCQQALSHSLVYALEHWSELTQSWVGKDSALGRFFVGFEKQEPNRLLAFKGSLDGSLATLDLSEASDRVLNQHVQLLFARFPQLSEAIQATRSRKADVPGHGVLTLNKYASMGSALCFPVEAMVFTTVIFAAIANERRVPLNRRFMMSLRGKVRVYGDDIIVPVEYVYPVIRALEAFGLKVNRDKSFWNGKFRESCGGDYFNGEWVTPVRLRKDLPQSRADAENVVGLVAFRNNLYWSGYWKTARRIDDWLRILLKGHYPVVSVTAAGLGRESVLPYQAERFHPHTHVPLVKGWISVAKPPASLASGEGALLKFFLKRSVEPSQDVKHLERQGRPKQSSIKLRGIRPY
jgi:hypothetical protein